MEADVWENVWGKDLIVSDYSLKYLRFISEIEKDLKSGSKVIEVGSGTGQTLSIFSKRHATTGFDISKNALLLSRKNCHCPIRGNLLEMPFKDESFDFVYNSGVIEHFKEPFNIQGISEMCRITKKGGHILIIVPNSLCVWYRIYKFILSSFDRFEFGYEEDYSIWRLRNSIKSTNYQFDVISEFGLQSLVPLATNDKEICSESVRRKIGNIEKYFPNFIAKYIAYAIGIYITKL